MFDVACLNVVQRENESGRCEGEEAPDKVRASADNEPRRLTNIGDIQRTRVRDAAARCRLGVGVGESFLVSVHGDEEEGLVG